MTIRDLLLRVADQSPPIYVHPEFGPSRRYIGGGLAWVLSTDNRTVITFYHHGTNKQAQKVRRRKDRRP